MDWKSLSRLACRAFGCSAATPRSSSSGPAAPTPAAITDELLRVPSVVSSNLLLFFSIALASLPRTSRWRKPPAAESFSDMSGALSLWILSLLLADGGTTSSK